MKLSGNDKKILETLFEMGGGYVLDFSDRRMKDFFYDEFEIDIYDAKYDLDFPSKSTANRLRGIWLVESGETVGKIILSLVEYLETTLLVDAKEVSSHTKDLILKARQIGAKLQFPDFAKDYEPFIKMITKKEIFATLGSDLILKDRKLFISWDKLLFPIKSMALEVREIKERLEPAKKPIDAKDMGEIYSHNPRLLRVLDDVRTSLISISDLNWFRIVKTW